MNKIVLMNTDLFLVIYWRHRESGKWIDSVNSSTGGAEKERSEDIGMLFILTSAGREWISCGTS